MNTQQFQARFRSPRNPLEWIVAILLFGVVLSLAVVFLGVAIVAIAFLILFGPLIRWWNQKKGGAAPAPAATPTATPDVIDGPIVDAEFEVQQGGSEQEGAENAEGSR